MRLRLVTAAITSALILQLAACDRECDVAALQRLVEVEEPPIAAWQEQEERDIAERRRVSAGIRAACTRMTNTLATTLNNLYETKRDIRRPGPIATPEQREENVSLMDRACPGWTDVMTELGKIEAEQRARIMWDRCKWTSSELYRGLGPGDVPKPGQRTLFDQFDFAVFFYLQDHGADSALATAVVRRLGHTETADRPPLTLPEDIEEP